MRKESFILYTGQKDLIDELSTVEKGILLDAIFEFQLTGRVIEMDTACRIVFKSIQNQFRLDSQKYDKHIKKQKANGSKGGRPPKNENPKNPWVFSETHRNLKVKGKRLNVKGRMLKAKGKRLKVKDYFFSKKQNSKFFPESSEVSGFVKLYSESKNQTFRPSSEDRKNIAKVLNSEGCFEKLYWQSVFNKAKQGWRNKEGKKIKCTLSKILERHSAIYNDEAYLNPLPPEKKSAQSLPVEVSKPLGWINFESIKSKKEAIKYLLQIPTNIRCRTQKDRELMGRYGVKNEEINDIGVFNDKYNVPDLSKRGPCSG